MDRGFQQFQTGRGGQQHGDDPHHEYAGRLLEVATEGQHDRGNRQREPDQAHRHGAPRAVGFRGGRFERDSRRFRGSSWCARRFGARRRRRSDRGFSFGFGSAGGDGTGGRRQTAKHEDRASDDQSRPRDSRAIVQTRAIVHSRVAGAHFGLLKSVVVGSGWFGFGSPGRRQAATTCQGPSGSRRSPSGPARGPLRVRRRACSERRACPAPQRRRAPRRCLAPSPSAAPIPG